MTYSHTANRQICPESRSTQRLGLGAKLRLRRGQLAERLRVETVRTVEWLAQRLHLGSRAYAHHLLWRARRKANDNNKN